MSGESPPASDPLTARRNFLRFLAASPLVVAGGALACDAEDAAETDEDGLRAGTLGEPDQALGQLVTNVDDAIDVFDMRVTAEATLPPAHYGYIAGITAIRSASE
jgi:hypothetical protein